MNDWVQVVGLIVIPIIALLGLFYYVRAAIEQAGAMQKPCIVLHSMLRDTRDAILDRDNIRGDLVISSIDGLVALENIGTGPAVNVEYIFEKVGEPSTPLRSQGSIPTLASHEKLATHVAQGIFAAHRFECTVIYQSLSKRRYETHVSASDTVLGEFKFRRMGRLARLTHSVSDWRWRSKSGRFEKIA